MVRKITPTSKIVASGSIKDHDNGISLWKTGHDKLQRRWKMETKHSRVAVIHPHISRRYLLMLRKNGGESTA